MTNTGDTWRGEWNKIWERFNFWHYFWWLCFFGNSLPSICDDMLARLFATTYAQLFVKNIQVTKIRSHQLSPGNDAPHDSNMQCIHPVVPLALTQDPQDHQDGWRSVVPMTKIRPRGCWVLGKSDLGSQVEIFHQLKMLVWLHLLYTSH